MLKFIFLRVIFLLVFFSTPIFSQWFWKEHYYEIPFGGEKYYSKGKPRIEGEFTIFNKWPENLEWRVKTQHVKLIKDIGPDSPEELEAKANAVRKQLISIFKPLISLNKKEKWLTSSELKELRGEGYSDDQIWSVLNEASSCYIEAQQSGFTLDQIATFSQR